MKKKSSKPRCPKCASKRFRYLQLRGLYFCSDCCAKVRPDDMPVYLRRKTS